MRLRRYTLGLSIAISLVALPLHVGAGPATPSSIQFHGGRFPFAEAEVKVTWLCAPLESYRFSLAFRDSVDEVAVFGFNVPNEDLRGFLKVGEHSATGEYWNFVEWKGPGANIKIKHLDFHQLTLVWESGELVGDRFSGSGYVEIRERLNYVCRDSIETSWGTFRSGDTMYEIYYQENCEPQFYFPPQVIYFSCDNKIHVQ